jgi:hypothetical protein
LADSDEEVFKIVSDFYSYLFFVPQNEQNALESKLCVNDIKPFLLFATVTPHKIS